MCLITQIINLNTTKGIKYILYFITLFKEKKYKKRKKIMGNCQSKWNKDIMLITIVLTNVLKNYKLTSFDIVENFGNLMVVLIYLVFDENISKEFFGDNV